MARNIQALVRAKADFDKVFKQFSRSSKRAGKDGKEAFDKTDKGAKKARGSVRGLNRQMNTLARTSSRVRQILGIGGGLFTGFTAARALRTLVDFDRGLVSVGKTAGIAGDELQALGDDVVDLSLKLTGVGTDRLLALGEVAGQLGIHGSRNILKFVETIARLEAATDIRGSVGGRNIARLIQISGGDIANVDRYGAAIVDLGNNLAATEREIAAVGIEVAKGSQAYDIATEDVLGLAAATAALGIPQEIARSSFLRTFRAIDDAVRRGGPQLTKFSELAEKSAEDFAKAYRDNATDALLDVLRGLDRAGDAGESTAIALESLGLTGLRVTPILQTMAKQSEFFADSVDRSREATEAGTAHIEESEKQYNTLGARLTAIKTSFDAVIISQRNNVSGLKDLADNAAGAVRILGGVGETADFASDGAVRLAGAIEAMTAAAAGFLTIKLATGLVALGAGFASIPLAATLAATSLIFFSSRSRRATESVEQQRKAIEGYKKTLEDIRDVGESVRQAAAAGDPFAQLRVASADVRAANEAFRIIEDQIRAARKAGKDPIDIRVDVTQIEAALRGTEFAKKVDIGAFIEFRGDPLKKQALNAIERSLILAAEDSRISNIGEELADKILGSGFGSTRLEAFRTEFLKATFGSGNSTQKILDARRAAVVSYLNDLKKEANSVRASDALDFAGELVSSTSKTEAAAEKGVKAISGVGDAADDAGDKLAAAAAQLRKLQREAAQKAFDKTFEGVEEQVKALEIAVDLQKQYNLSAADAVAIAQQERLTRKFGLEESNKQMAEYIANVKRATELQGQLDLGDDAPAREPRRRTRRRSSGGRGFRAESFVGDSARFLPQSTLKKLEDDVNETFRSIANQPILGQLVESNRAYAESLSLLNARIEEATTFGALFVANLEEIGDELSDPARLAGQLAADLTGGVRGALGDAAQAFRESGELSEAGKVLGTRLVEAVTDALFNQLADRAVGLGSSALGSLGTVLGLVGGTGDGEGEGEGEGAAAGEGGGESLFKASSALTAAAGAVQAGGQSVEQGGAGLITGAVKTAAQFAIATTTSTSAAAQQITAAGLLSFAAADLIIAALQLQAAAAVDTFAAKGKVFSSRGVHKFASGTTLRRKSSNDFFTAATDFAISGGGVGRAGEAGTEVVAPLKRGPDGRMGIEASGFNPEVNVTVPPFPAINVRLPSRQPDEAAFGGGSMLPFHDARPRASSFGGPISISVTHNPQITIEGNADRDTMNEALAASNENLKAELRQEMEQVAFAQTKVAIVSDEETQMVIRSTARDGASF